MLSLVPCPWEMMVGYVTVGGRGDQALGTVEHAICSCVPVAVLDPVSALRELRDC